MPEEATAPIRHAVYRSINKPLLFCGVDRSLFFFAVVMGAAVFNLFNSVLGGLLVLAVCYGFAHWATKTDPEILSIMLKPILNPGKYRPQLDPAKLQSTSIHLERDR